jgi:hypothetical protein
MSRPLLSYLGEAAAGYARRGWPVLPLHNPVPRGCSCRDATCQSIGKHPRPRHGLRDAAPDLEQITAWWRQWPHANIGIATGAPSGLVVIDIDPQHGGETILRQLHRNCPPPRTAQAGSGTGRHLYYTSAHPVPSSIGRLGPGLDIRGDGSYIVAPPSRHASGRSYRWIIRIEIAALPRALAARISPPRPSPVNQARPAIADLTAYARAALDAETRAVATAPDGQRNNTLYRAALKLGQLTAAGLLTEPHISDRLLAVAIECGLPHPEAHRTIASGLRNGTRAPRRPTIQPPAIELH